MLSAQDDRLQDWPLQQPPVTRHELDNDGGQCEEMDQTQDWWLLQRPVLQPVILCGQHSLALFCFGVCLSFVGHIILVEISNILAAQFLVSAGGIVLMVGAAWLMTRYEMAEGRGPGAGDFAAQEAAHRLDDGEPDEAHVS